jgi:CRISPR-associated protein Csm2
MDINLSTMDTPEIVQKAENMALQFTRDKLKTNQIRNFYSAITRMRAVYEQAEEGKGYERVKNQLIMLRPKLAYAAGRQTAVRANFYPFMTTAIQSIEQASDKSKSIENFFLLVESVVAYHKFHGGE